MANNISYPYMPSGQSGLLGALFGKSLIIFILAAVFSLGLFAWEDFLDEWDVFLSEAEDSPLVILAKVSVGITLLALIWRIYLAAAYRPAPPCPDFLLPSCTVVIPAYNEGFQVLKTIRSVADSDYPPEKMQIIAVDDGSKDDTWDWMQKAAAELEGRVEIIQLPRNSGKRRALFEGFEKSTGEILVTIDSDSEVTKDSLRHLISPFVRETLVGAVAGNVKVLNIDEGIIPKMLDVTFAFSFDFMRAGQSQINTVLTTPGALSAYRGCVVRPLLRGWLEQRFLGRVANIGEDRALTNLVLKSGHLAHFARGALVLTQVPVHYSGLCKMFLRWARSNVRETVVMGGFIFKQFRTVPALGARVNFLLHLFRMMVGEFFKISTFCVILTAPYFMGYNLLLGPAVGGLLPAAFYLLLHRNTNFLWAFPYSVFWMFALSWISLYALLTPHKNSWLTRGLTKPAPARS